MSLVSFSPGLYSLSALNPLGTLSFLIFGSADSGVTVCLLSWHAVKATIITSQQIPVQMSNRHY